MGLGPSVCLDCMLTLGYREPDGWVCEKCGNTDGPRIGYVFCMTMEQLEEIDRNEARPDRRGYAQIQRDYEAAMARLKERGNSAADA